MLRIQIHKTTSFWLLEAQNDVVFGVSFFFFLKKPGMSKQRRLGYSDLKKKKKEPQNDFVLGCSNFFKNK